MTTDSNPSPPKLYNKLSSAVLEYMFRKSTFEEALMGEPMDHEDRSNVLRMRIMDGQDLTAEEMLYEVNRIRQDRRSAGPAGKPSAKRKAPTAQAPENLLDILDQDI